LAGIIGFFPECPVLNLQNVNRTKNTAILKMGFNRCGCAQHIKKYTAIRQVLFHRRPRFLAAGCEGNEFLAG